MPGDLEGLRADAAGQDGQFAVRQAWKRGFTRSALRNLRDAGHIVTLRRGVARFAAVPGDPDVAITACLACWPHGVISHSSAAAFHKISHAAKHGPAEVTVPRGAMAAPAGVVVHSTRYLPGCDILKVGGVKYTSLARTVCDLAESCNLWETLTRLDDAVARGAKPSWVHQRASALAHGRAGVAAVAAATAPGASAEFRSWLERAAAHVYREAHIPDPEWNVPVYDGSGLIGIADALWPSWRVISEKEGLRFHTKPRQRRVDARRFNRFADARYAARRFSWQDVVETPTAVAATLLRALRAAGADVDLLRIPSEIVLPGRPFLPTPR